MTNKIYEKNSYLRELDTVVSECISENGRIYLKLRETIFFPEEGGQYSDTGVIDMFLSIIQIRISDILSILKKRLNPARKLNACLIGNSVFHACRITAVSISSRA